MKQTRDGGARPSGADTSVEDIDGVPSAWQRLLNVGGLLLIVMVFAVLMLRIGGGEDRPMGEARSEEGGADGQASVGGEARRLDGRYAAIAGRSTSLPPLMLPEDPGVADREPLAGLPGAMERFGEAFTIRHPTYLPADVAPFTVNWQPDRQPDRRARGYGELFTWFYSTEHGAVLLLAQGPGTGVWPLTAGDERAGRVRLADGTEVVWIIGHPTSVTGSVAGAPEWEGTEITIGVLATDDEGWYLSSPIVSLEELIRIANSLRPVASSQ